MIKLSDSFTYQIKEVGIEKSPVIIIDNLLYSTDTIYQQAVNSNYKAPEAKFSYPGVRADIEDIEYTTLVSDTVADIFEKHFTTGQNLKFIANEATFSILTTKEEDLQPNQCIPHFDGPWADRLAVIHYINEGDFGGTAFYQHKPTKFEKITQHRLAKYTEKATLHTEIHGFPQNKYFAYSNDHFELLEAVDYKPNRVVIYPAAILHSGFIEYPEKNICSDPAVGRLTANFFLTATR